MNCDSLVIYLVLLLHLSNAASTPCWNVASLSQARSSLAATSVANLALFAGGQNSDGSASAVVDIFNLTSNTWTVASLSSPRFLLAATTVKHLALFAGGQNGSNPSSVVDIYDSISNKWSVTNLSQPRQRTSATTVGNLAIFAGGDFGTPVSTVDIYNTTSNSWTTSRISQPCTFMVSSSLGNLAIFASGTSTVASTTDQVDIYNAASNSWNVTTLHRPGNFMAATTVGDLSLIAGGFSDTYGRLDIVNIYNHTSGAWSWTPSLSAARNALTATTVRNFAIFAGGIVTYPVPTKLVDIYNFASDTWNPSQLSQARSFLAATSLGNYAFFGGGILDDNSPSTIVDILNETCLSCMYDQTQCIISNQNNTLAIVLSCVFGVLGITIIIVVIFIILKKRRKHQNENDVPLSIRENHMTNIEIKERLGEGHFGEVYRGLWQGTTDVALKKLKTIDKTPEFENEAFMLKSLNHPNIIQYLGIFESAEKIWYIATEFLPEGSLDRLLQNNASKISIAEIVGMMKDAAAGMEYLRQQNIVHRDLALRNLLVSRGTERSKYLIKIADFGMSRIITTMDYYKSENSTMPVKWSAPEVLNFGRFSFLSDCWSFGIVLWEAFSYGKIPYPGMSNRETIKAIESGYRMDPPEKCPEEICQLMKACWNIEPERRPTLKEAFDVISQVEINFRHSTSSLNQIETLYSNNPMTDSTRRTTGYTNPKRKSIGDSYTIPEEKDTNG